MHTNSWVVNVFCILKGLNQPNIFAGIDIVDARMVERLPLVHATMHTSVVLLEFNYMRWNGHVTCAKFEGGHHCCFVSLVLKGKEG